MSSDIKVTFKKYEPVIGEKHMGIATILYEGPILLRYKIQPKKEGGGWFPCCGSYKMPISATQGEHYDNVFEIDSNSACRDIEDVIRQKVALYLANPNAMQNSSSQSTQQYQGNVSYGSNTYVAPQPTQSYSAPIPESEQQDMFGSITPTTSDLPF